VCGYPSNGVVYPPADVVVVPAIRVGLRDAVEHCALGAHLRRRVECRLEFPDRSLADMFVGRPGIQAVREVGHQSEAVVCGGGPDASGVDSPPFEPVFHVQFHEVEVLVVGERERVLVVRSLTDHESPARSYGNLFRVPGQCVGERADAERAG